MPPEELDDTERAELDQLRHEVTELRRQARPGGDGDGKAARGGSISRPRYRSILAYALVVLAVVLTPLAVVARYLRSELLDTDRYVETVAPLAHDEALQDVIADRVTDQIFVHLDVEATVAEALDELVDQGAPELVVGLATPIADQVEGFVDEHIRDLLATDQFADLWAEANRVAHDQLDAVLSGDTDGVLDVEDGVVSLDLGALVQQIKERLLDRGFQLAERLPDDVDQQLTIFESGSLARAQNATRWLDRTATVLPLVVFALIAGAVLVAPPPNRRRTLLAAAIGISLSMLVLALVLAVLRAWYLENGAPQTMSTEAAVSIAHTLLAPLRTAMRAVLALGVVVIVAVLVTGPSPAAHSLRTAASRGIDAVRERVRGDRQPTAAEAWIGGHKGPLRLAVIAVGALALAAWSYPSGAVVLGIALAVLAGLFLLEAFGRQAPLPEDSS